MQIATPRSSLPLFTPPFHARVVTITRPHLAPTCNRRRSARPRYTCAITSSSETTTTLSRRTFSTLLASLSLASIAPPAHASDISGLVTRYKDLPKGFTILRPNGWNEFEGMQDSYDIKWQDVIQPLEFVTVLTTAVSKDKTVGDIGGLKEVGKKLAEGRGGKLIEATEKDIDGVSAYVFEIRKGPSHQLTLLAMNKQKLYSVNASCPEKRWGKREKLLRGVVDSFKPKL